MQVSDFHSFIEYTNKHIRGDEKGEAQVFLDHFFQALLPTANSASEMKKQILPNLLIWFGRTVFNKF
jgi:hypothetical protein